MLILLCVSFVTLKIKSPSFPEDNQDECEKDNIKRALWMGIAVSLLGLTHISLSVILTHSPIALTFINQFLCNSIVKVGCMMYFICKTPKHFDYVRNFFQYRVNFLCFLLQQFLDFFRSPPNQIDCIIWIQVFLEINKGSVYLMTYDVRYLRSIFERITLLLT